eukprot:8883231-Pyramimonas_sp.AAC.1
MNEYHFANGQKDASPSPMRGDSIAGFTPYSADEFGQSWRHIVDHIRLQSHCSAWCGQVLKHKFNGNLSSIASIGNDMRLSIAPLKL